MDSNERMCLTYFKNNSVWKKVLGAFWKKYESYGAFSGSIKLKKLSGEELEELEGFFGTNFHGQESITISSKKFAKGLQESRFAFIKPERLLELYFDEKLISKKERKNIRHLQREAAIEKVVSEYQDTPAAAMLDEIVEIVKYDEATGVEVWQNTLRIGAEIINNLPYRKGEMTYLAVFATKITGNPHAFQRKLFFRFFCIQFGLKLFRFSAHRLLPN